MATNKVKKIRTQLSLSQRELAKRAGTSQQQIQRIEAGKITTNLALAKAICSALGKPLEVVFPEAAKALNDLHKEVQEAHYTTDDALTKIADRGIEADNNQWFLKVLLQGHSEHRIFPISPSEKRRLYTIVQDEGDSSSVHFAVFDSTDRRVALNLGEVSFCQFLFEPAIGQIEPEDSGDEAQELLITMAGGGPTVGLGVDADTPDDNDIGQLDHIFFMLENGPDAGDRYRITDEEGEDAFIRAGSVALLQAPLWTLRENDDAEDNE